MARLRAVFRVPEHMETATFGENIEPPAHLAYVEWFTRPKDKDPNHGMYPITYSRNAAGKREYAVIEHGKTEYHA